MSTKRAFAPGFALVPLVASLCVSCAFRGNGGVAAAASAPAERVIAGSPKDSMEVRHLVLTGTNEEIGRALARIARERYQVQPRRNGEPWRARAHRRYIEKNYPILYERMKGVASSFGHRVDDDEWDHAGLGYFDLQAGCSIAYLPPGSTETGKGVVSRDYDYSTGSINFGFLEPGKLHPTARPYLLELHPDQGYASLAMVAYDLLSGVTDGINSEGLTVTMAMDDELFEKYQPEPTLEPSTGLGELQTLRLLLDTCATAEEAKETLLQTKQYYQYVPIHYLIADRFGNSFVWEYSHAHNKEYVIENPARPLVLTNFSLNRHLDGDRPPTVALAKGVCRRYCLLTEQLANAPGKVSEDLIRTVHHEVDAELPASADTSRPPIRTFWHALYYPEERRVKLSFYLRDEPIPNQPNGVRIVRSDYQEFRLAPTGKGKAPPPAAPAEPSPAAHVDEPKRAAAPAGTGVEQAAIAELKRHGATVKTEGSRVVSVELDNVDDAKAVLPLLRELSDLNEVTFQNDKLDDAGMALLQGLTKLTRLNLRQSAIGDEGLKVVASMPGLRTLNVGKTRVTDAGLSYIAGLPRLEVLILTGDDISDAGLAHLANSRGIGGLFLAGTHVTDKGLVYLKGMSKLTKLNLTNTPVTDQGIADAKKFLPFWMKVLRDKP